MGRMDEEKEEKEEDKSPQLIYIFHTEHTLHWKCWKIFIIESGSSCTFCATSTPSSISPHFFCPELTKSLLIISNTQLLLLLCPPHTLRTDCRPLGLVSEEDYTIGEL